MIELTRKQLAWFFDAEFYLANAPDVAASGMDPLEHFTRYGAAEGRDPGPIFDTAFYLAANPDVAASGMGALVHFLRHGMQEGRDPNAFFSSAAYLAANPDVAASGMGAFLHFIEFGWREGRSPGDKFDAAFYLRSNPDVAAAGMNPLVHYLKYGMQEGRAPTPPPPVDALPDDPAPPPPVDPPEDPVPPAPTFALSADAELVEEGGTVTFDLAVTGLPEGTLINYVITGVQAGDVAGGLLTGTAILDALGHAYVQVTLVEDATTEGAETLTLTMAEQSLAVTVGDTSMAPTLFTLTASLDSITGTERDDTIVSLVAGGLTLLDSIDGGLGDGDLLSVTDAGAISIAAGPTVQNVERAEITSGSTVSLDTSGWTGLLNLEVVAVGPGSAIVAGGTTAVSAVVSVAANGSTAIDGGSDIDLTVTGLAGGAVFVGATTAPTGAVSVEVTHEGTTSGAHIGVRGGTTVHIAQTQTNAVNTTATNAQITVEGTALTTAVTVVNAARATASADTAGVNANSVMIIDANHGSATEVGTIAAISVANVTSLGIASTGLTTLSIAGGSGNIILDNSGLTTPVHRTLDVTMDGQTAGTLDDADIVTTLNLTTTGRASTLSNLTFGALTTLAIDGDARLTLTSTAGLTSLQTVTVTGAAGVTADFTGANVTSVDTTGTIGASRVTINASRTDFAGGEGADSVTLAAATPTHAISLGGGDDSLDYGSISALPGEAISGGEGQDALRMSASFAAVSSANDSFASLVSGFETLSLTGATNQTIGLATLGIDQRVIVSGGNGLTLTGLVDGGTMELTGAGTAYTISNSAFASGADNTIHLVLRDGSGAGVAFASTGITASGVEHIEISVLDTQATPSGTFNDSVTLLGNAARTITIDGNAGLTLTATSTALTSVDASGIGLGGFTWTSGALANAAEIHGSATGTNTVNFSAANRSVTYVGGTGDDAVTGTNGASNSVALGEGNNSYVGNNRGTVVSAGAGNDAVTLSGGNNTVTLGDGTNSFTTNSGNNTYVGGSGVDTVTLGGGMNVLTLGDGADQVTLNTPSANLNIYTSITDVGTGDRITFADLGTETFNTTKVTLGRHAVFQDYANAVIQAAGNASVNGAFGWFQFDGDTYLVQSRHDGSGNNSSFVNGTDMIVELVGLHDLSAAMHNGASFTIGSFLI